MPAAPAAPAPAPAKPAAPPPQSKPAAPRPAIQPPPEPPADEWMHEESLELDSLDDDNQPPRPAPKTRSQETEEPEEPEEKEEPEKPEKPEKPKGEAEEKETPEAEPDEPEPQTPDPEKMPARDLRKAYENSQRKIREELQPKISKLETRVKELESSGAEPSAMAAQLKTISEENKKLKERLAENDYREHPDFKSKQATFETQFERTRRDLSQIEVENTDGTTRKVTDEDIILLANTPFGKDRTLANKMFGDSAEDVLLHTRKIRELAEDQDRWVEESRQNATKVAQEREAQSNAKRIERAKAFGEANNALAEKFPFWFKPKEGDKEGNATLEAGVALTNLMFGLKNSPEQVKLLPKHLREEIESNGQLSPEGTIRLHALVRSKAMNHDRIARWMKQLRKELKETKEALAQFEQSEPPTGGSARRRAGGGGGPQAVDDYEAEIEDLARKGR